MMRAGKMNKIILCIIAMAMVVCSIFMMGQPIIAFAAGNSNNYDNTNVLDDLKSSTVHGKGFDITKYPFNENLDVQIITFVEYCYSFRSNERNNYGLYVYVYNPKSLNISTTSKSNKIQMAVEYDSEGIPTRYEKFNLQFCSKVEYGDYKNLFYKFKVVDRNVNGTTFADRVNSISRQYDISGIELLTYGDKNATEYGVGGSYVFTGYAEGYGPDSNAKSTLSCTVKDLETLELEVHHTNFRTNVSSLGAGHYNEVNTVYFSVPERVFKQYGYLQKIRAEWWEYKTKMAAITSNQEFYNQLLKYVGTDVGSYDSTVPVYLYSGYNGIPSSDIGSPTMHNFDWVYNKNVAPKYTSLGSISDIYFYKQMSTIMPYAFYSPVVDVDSVLSFLYTDPIAGDVESTIVQEYIYNYSNKLGNGYIDCNGREISVDLFENFVDAGRTMGYNDKTIDLSDTFDLNSYDSNHNWWDKLWDYGFSWPATDGDYSNVAPIYELTEDDLVGTNDQIASRILVNSSDVSDLKKFYKKETEAGNRVILFRFANTDYYCAPAFTPYVSNITQTDTYVAQQTVFFDFDIIELTFNKDGVYHVIPVVSSPTDIINGFTAPKTEFQWWKVLLALILGILLIVILMPFLPYVIQLVLWVILLPFKLIGAIAKVIKRSKRKRQYNEFNKEE